MAGRPRVARRCIICEHDPAPAWDLERICEKCRRGAPQPMTAAWAAQRARWFERMRWRRRLAVMNRPRVRAE